MTPEAALALPETCCPALWLWPGQAMYAGPSLDLGRHSGSVSCFALGVDDSFSVRTARHDLEATRSALIAPRLPHRLVSRGGRMVFCYLDPASDRERTCRLRMTAGDGQLGSGHAEQDALIRLGARLTTDTADAGHWLELAAPAGTGAADARIQDAARRLREQPNPALPAAALASAAGLSTSRFLHLFREHTGTSFRRYRLWARMLRAGTVLAGGGDLTSAAAEAGFASPSHFSDSFHAMFGLPPSRLLAAGVTIRIEPQNLGTATAL
ncbi:helix-turn-helix domain-containing protein [Amycolatopsis nigrescens]|uniref:helix-turn-helix domain-containing protein n=1 Tax=Amycolatopsis nigrescens TaxID=381445 RepID=UPI0003674E50|nr:helix-turn-helix domain-containing protein [Amycolatopsis nigrescens]